ncbi:MAG: formimidoylglutamase [Flavobacteriaceae bacterium]
MISNYLSPVSSIILEEVHAYADERFGTKLQVHSTTSFPDLNGVSIAIIAVKEGRNAINNESAGADFSELRKEIYKLYGGNWHLNIADLGDVNQGNTIKDTHFALKTIVTYLIKKNIIPIVLGGSQALTYTLYRAYDELEQTVNLVSVDQKFDLGDLGSDLNSRCYLSKIVMEEPNNLFNYSNIGYQTFFNSQEEIDLLEKLYFDSYRLGIVNKNISVVEPIMRDADLVSIDIGALRKTEAPANNNTTPNGFYGEEMCSIARYAGLSDKVTALGVFEYANQLDDRNQTAQLIAQIIWYFIEGVNFRIKEFPFDTKKTLKKYIVPIDDDVINFYKSNKTNRWWMEVKDNKFNKETLIPCAQEDYLEAINQNIPERWWKTLRKLT